MSYTSRLNHALQDAPVFTFYRDSRYCIFSDCHRGDGSSNDNLLKNESLYISALKYYDTNGFTYIELGDGDELWENRNMESIVEVHNQVFCLFSSFHAGKRLIMLYGNHDMVKRNPCFAKRYCSSCFCAKNCCRCTLFPNLVFYESIILEPANHKYRLYLTHGHQADFWNSTAWRINRFLVRYIWKPLEHYGVLDPTSAAKNYHHKNLIEKKLESYAKKENITLITGHTHRPRLLNTEPFFINTGSCVHPYSVTCLELQNDTLSLVKWTYDTKTDRTLYVKRELLSQVQLFPY